MICLEELIGIKDACNPVVGTSNYYVQDLPFITDDMPELSLNKKSDTTVLDYFLNKRRLASDIVAGDILRMIGQMNDYQLSGTVAVETVGQATQQFAQVVPNQSGIRITACDGCGDRLTKQKVKSIRLYPLSDWSGDLLVNDGFTITTQPVTLQANVVKMVVIDRVIEWGQYLDVTLDGASNYVYRQISQYWSSCNCTSKSLASVTVSSINNGALGAGYYYGMVVDIQTVCDTDLLLCEMASQFVRAMFYKIGYLILEHRKMNFSRLNAATKNKTDLGEDLARYGEMYQEELKKSYLSVRQYLANSKSLCVICRGSKIRQYGM